MRITDAQERIESFFDRTEIAGIVSVYLFGSVARDAAHQESDVDLGVLADWKAHPTAKDRFELRLELIGLLEGELPSRVDLVMLNDVPPTLGREIAIHGRRVLCRDEQTDHAWSRDTQLKAADIDPFLSRMRRIKLEAITR